MEENNIRVLTCRDLALSIASIDESVRSRPNRLGLTRVIFEDEYDSFDLKISFSSSGYALAGCVNGMRAYHLCGRHFSGSISVGRILLVAAGAPSAETVESYFGGS